MSINAIVIDMDGTITEFNLDFVSFRRLQLAELEKMNLRTPDMTEEVSSSTILARLKNKVDEKTYRIVRKRMYDMVEGIELKAANEVTLYPGAVDTLRKLRARPMKIGLLTNNSRKGTDLTLSRHGLQRFFDAVVTRDDCEDMKPAAEPVLSVLAKLNVKPESAILIGDGVLDILAAKAAKVRSAAVATGPFKSELLLKTEPDYILGSINDLPALIDSLETCEVPETEQPPKP